MGSDLEIYGVPGTTTQNMSWIPRICDEGAASIIKARGQSPQKATNIMVNCSLVECTRCFFVYTYEVKLKLITGLVVRC